EPSTEVIARDIDVLIVSSLHPAADLAMLSCLGRLLALAGRWRLLVHSPGAEGVDRGLLCRSRIVLSHGRRGQGCLMALETVRAGALLFQEEGNLDVPAILCPGSEYVVHAPREPLVVLERSREDESARQAVVDAAAA